MSLGRLTQDYCEYCGYKADSNLCECYNQEEYCYNPCDCNTIYIPPTPIPVTLTTLGTGNNLVIGGIGPNLTIKSVSSGTGITFVEANNNIEIQSSNSVVSLSSAGTGTTLVVNGAAPNLTIKSISQGPGISFIGTSGNVEISSVSSVVTLEATGTIGENIVAFGTGPNLKVKYIGVTGTGLSVSSDANNNILFQNTSPASSVTLQGTGTIGENIVAYGTGPNLKVKYIGVTGTGLSVSSDANNNILFENTSPASLVTLEGTGTIGENIVAYGTGPNLKVKYVGVTGTGLSVSSDANNNILFENTSPASSVTLEGTGTLGENIVAFGTGPNLKVKYVGVTGTGLSVSSDANNNILFENTSPASLVTLQTTGTLGENIVAFGNGPNLIVKNIGVTGTGLSVTADGNNILFENTSVPSAVSLNSTGAGVPLVPSPNVGPTMSIKSLISGTGITMADSGSDITISSTISNIIYPLVYYEIQSPDQVFTNPVSGTLIKFNNVSTPPSTATFAGIQSIGVGNTDISLPIGEYLVTMCFYFQTSVAPPNTTYIGVLMNNNIPNNFGMCSYQPLCDSITNLPTGIGQYVASCPISCSFQTVITFGVYYNGPGAGFPILSPGSNPGATSYICIKRYN